MDHIICITTEINQALRLVKQGMRTRHLWEITRQEKEGACEGGCGGICHGSHVIGDAVLGIRRPNGQNIRAPHARRQGHKQVTLPVYAAILRHLLVPELSLGVRQRLAGFYVREIIVV